MSFISIPTREFRLQRSVLSVPAINTRLFEKALNSSADYIMLDCEDSVAPADKPTARSNVITALNEFDWAASGKTLMVRVNGLDTHYNYRDIVEIVEQGGNAIKSIMLPKAGCASDIYMLDCLLTQIESAKKINNKIAIEALIESALGVANVTEIAAASDRLQALHFGAGDFAASCGARTVSIGGLHPDFPGDPWHPVLQDLVIACRTNGLRPIDSAFGDFQDRDGYLASAKRAAALGFSGKWAIHPAQIELANEVMTPPAKVVSQAQSVLEAMQKAQQAGKGAVTLEGKMIDIASIRMAQHIVELDRAIRENE
jgi:citrate lyase subunit beta/citryl-CoA lyase